MDKNSENSQYHPQSINLKRYFLALEARILFQIKARRLLFNFNGPFLFNKKMYLNNNPDVIESGMDPFYHYMKYGWREGRNPNAYFDVSAYLRNNLDVKDNDQEPLSHYLSRGWKEGRPIKENGLAEVDVIEEINNMRPPLFIIGAPRSGTTFLVNVLNRHEMVYITNELRVMSFINDLFRNFLNSDRIDWIVYGEHRDEFLALFRKEMSTLIRKFYFSKMNEDQIIWGDKHPHYTDHVTDPGVMETILEVFPGAKIIHIYRNPRRVVNSIVSKGWMNFPIAVQRYREIVTNARKLKNQLGEERYMEIKYENLVDDGREVAKQICNFLKIPVSDRLLRYLDQQEVTRTPYAIPITEQDLIGKQIDDHISDEEEALIKSQLGEIMKELGYT